VCSVFVLYFVLPITSQIIRSTTYHITHTIDYLSHHRLYHRLPITSHIIPSTTYHITHYTIDYQSHRTYHQLPITSHITSSTTYHITHYIINYLSHHTLYHRLHITSHIYTNNYRPHHTFSTTNPKPLNLCRFTMQHLLVLPLRSRVLSCHGGAA